MKNKITKKEIKNAPRYIVRIDLKSSMRYEYGILENADLLSAMLEAEEGYHKEDAYLVDIFEKTDIIDSENNTIIYKSSVRSRTKGNWHACDQDHYEYPCAIQFDPRAYANGWTAFWYEEYEKLFACA